MVPTHRENVVTRLRVFQNTKVKSSAQHDRLIVILTCLPLEVASPGKQSIAQVILQFPCPFVARMLTQQTICKIAGLLDLAGPEVIIRQRNEEILFHGIE